ncbi:MAG: hypothetical protein ACREUI_09600 [Burkholderiales bacterium]
MSPLMNFWPKDFLETRESLAFAVVARGLEKGRALCFLRYFRRRGVWQKLTTAQANDLLRTHFPHYLFYSCQRAVRVHGVPPESVSAVYRPCERLRAILSASDPDALEAKTASLGRLLALQGVDLDTLGITGSLLLRAQGPGSDIDLVSYERASFHRACAAIATLINDGRLQLLTEALWRDAYARRGCSLSYEEFLWHEKRKGTKAAIDGVKFDLSLVQEEDHERTRFRKLNFSKIRAPVCCDFYAFDDPARFALDDPLVVEAVSFTPTYAGQARKGESIEVCGTLEQSPDGNKRIVVGSSREAPGEYIRVVR